MIDSETVSFPKVKLNAIIIVIYSFSTQPKKSKDVDLFIGFFGYELLNNLIDIKVPKQKNLSFPKGIFYKPEKKIILSNNLIYNRKKFGSGSFKIKKKKKN